jgi:hypothetical protein
MSFISKANGALDSLGLAPNDCVTAIGLRAINRVAREHGMGTGTLRRMRIKGMTRLDYTSYIEALSWCLVMSA